MKTNWLLLLVALLSLSGCYFSHTLPVDNTVHVKPGIAGKWVQTGKVRHMDLQFYLGIARIPGTNFYDVYALELGELRGKKTSIDKARKNYFIGYVTTVGGRDYLSLKNFTRRPRNIIKALNFKSRRMAFVYKIRLENKQLVLYGMSEKFMMQAYKNKDIDIERGGGGPLTIVVDSNKLKQLVATGEGRAFADKAVFKRYTPKQAIK